MKITLISSAPKEVLAVISDKKERFPGAHVIGWAIVVFAVLHWQWAAGCCFHDIYGAEI